jgi:membrane protein involved in colicin uptake
MSARTAVLDAARDKAAAEKAARDKAAAEKAAADNAAAEKAARDKAAAEKAAADNAAAEKALPTGDSSQKKEVYYADKGGTIETKYNFNTLADAEAYATSLGGTIATFSQLQEAYEKGLHQCSFAWAWGKDGEKGNVYTVTTKPANGVRLVCSSVGVTNFSPSVAIGGVWVYGVKKPKAQSVDCTNSTVPCILPFSDTKWSQYD